jgi:hypothetical protein
LEERHQVAAVGLVTAVAKREPFFPWLFKNSGLYLFATLIGTILLANDDGWLELGAGGILYYWALFAMYVFVAGWVAHLLLIGLTPADWPRSRARLLSVVTSPVILLVPMIGEGLFLGWWLAVAVGYGAVARLRQPKGA